MRSTIPELNASVLKWLKYIEMISISQQLQIQMSHGEIITCHFSHRDCNDFGLGPKRRAARPPRRASRHPNKDPASTEPLCSLWNLQIVPLELHQRNSTVFQLQQSFDSNSALNWLEIPLDGKICMSLGQKNEQKYFNLVSGLYHKAVLQAGWELSAQQSRSFQHLTILSCHGGEMQGANHVKDHVKELVKERERRWKKIKEGDGDVWFLQVAHVVI